MRKAAFSILDSNEGSHVKYAAEGTRDTILLFPLGEDSKRKIFSSKITKCTMFNNNKKKDLN